MPRVCTGCGREATGAYCPYCSQPTVVRSAVAKTGAKQEGKELSAPTKCSAEKKGSLPMNRLPGGYRTVAVLNLFGAALLLILTVETAVPAPPDELSRERVLAAGLLGLTGIALVPAGIGLLRGPKSWHFTQAFLRASALLFLVLGIWLGWEIARSIWWPTEAERRDGLRGLATLVALLGEAALVSWGAVLGIVGAGVGRYAGAGEDGAEPS